MKTLSTALTTSILFLSMAGPGAAQAPPERIPFEAYLTDAAGQPINDFNVRSPSASTTTSAAATRCTSPAEG